ncbi:MAG: M23 family metallopeptidase [Bdellovibrionales bacterium]
MLRWGLALFFILLSACGTYRTGTGDYRGAADYKGVGNLKAPSDYSTSVDSQDVSDDELRDARSHLGKGISYIPNGPFKLYWPVEAVRINRGFKPESDPHHEGLDLGGKRGLPILAAHDGVIIYAGTAFNGYGKMVLIEFNNEWATLYGHLDSFAVRDGMIVRAGDPIGAMGATGHATGVHLHFELMHNRSPVDPLPLLTNGRQLASELQRRKRRARR